MTIDFKRVKRSSQRDKDVVYGYMKRIQSIFPEDNPYFIIHQLIQDICLSYFHFIDTKILTHNEQSNLVKLINDNNLKGNNGMLLNNEWKLLFRASRDGMNRNAFFEKCDQKDNTICIIQTSDDHVFGGFTTLQWDKSKHREMESDPSAVVYFVRSHHKYCYLSMGREAELFPAKKGKVAVQHSRSRYLSFGRKGKAFHLQECGRSSKRTQGFRFEKCSSYRLDGVGKFGMHDDFTPTEIEVFYIA